MGHSSFHPLGIYSCQPLQVVLLGQELRLEPAHLTGAGSFPLRALPSHDHSHGWVLGKTLGIVGVVVAGQAAVDGLADQWDQVVADIAASTAFLEIVGGYGGKVQGTAEERPRLRRMGLEC